MVSYRLITAETSRKELILVLATSVFSVFVLECNVNALFLINLAFANKAYPFPIICLAK